MEETTTLNEKPPPLTEEEQAKVKRLIKIVPFLILAALIFMGVTGGLCLSGTINLAGQTTSLPHFGERLEFTLKYQVLSVFWLLFLILNVILQRAKSNALDPLSGRERFLEKQARILQNSFEQFILSAFAQIILVAFINEKWTLRTMPWVNFVFFIGRVAFYFGYPSYRSFGFFCNVIPSAGMIFVALYKFVEHLFF